MNAPFALNQFKPIKDAEDYAAQRLIQADHLDQIGQVEREIALLAKEARQARRRSAFWHKVAEEADRSLDAAKEQLAVLKVRAEAIKVDAAQPRKIIAEVCLKHGVSIRDLCSERQFAPLVRARWEAMHRLCDETKLSTVSVGRLLGDRDHTTVMHGLRQYRARLAAEASQ